MSSSSKTDMRHTLLAVMVAIGATLGGCSDIYFDRRETVALGADDAIATNRVTHMVDPWPRHSSNRNLAFNGERMQGAVERHRTHTIIQPRPESTSNLQSQLPPISTERIPVAPPPGAVAPAAAVK